MNSVPIAPLPPFRIGEGWDTHALVPGRKLILGGVEIAHTLGLLG
ncbi:MAG: 2-C-methyl-D-erythritol 2,4-cyclodiphosphate synthase, partial [Polaromonas sp.]|nr:2-C-methyl-D-erythritol 2,4-cyclodiphosphate synthase [Polaromonas sp.]